MWTITIKGEATTDYPNLKELDGIDCQDEFSEYFDGDESYANDVTDGYMRFEFENGKLFTITEYDSTRELTDEELSQLRDYTVGQWSDGIGEGFEQGPCYQAYEPYHKYTDDEKEKYDDCDEDDLDVFISPWSFEQVATIEQEEG